MDNSKPNHSLSFKSIKLYCQLADVKPLTLLVAKRLLQHCKDNRVVQNEVAEIADSSGT